MEPNQLLIAEIHMLLEPRQDLDARGWRRLEELIDRTQARFVERLRTDYPMLSEEDIQILMLIRSGLDCKEIARIGNVTPKSLRMRRYRIKQKMGVRCESLTEFVLALYRE